MFRITVSYHHPADPEQFLKHYRTVHAPLTKTMPGARFEWGVCETLDGTKPEHFVVGVLTFDSKEAAIAGLGSPEGEAGRADMVNFAAAGAVIDMHEVNVA